MSIWIRLQHSVQEAVVADVSSPYALMRAILKLCSTRTTSC